MKKLLQYYLKFIYISSPIFIILITIVNISELNFSKSFLAYLKHYLVNPYEKLIPIFLTISLLLLLSSFYFLFKRRMSDYKSFLIKAITNFFIILIIWGVSGYFAPCFDCNSGSAITGDQIPGIQSSNSNYNIS